MKKRKQNSSNSGISLMEAVLCLTVLSILSIGSWSIFHAVQKKALGLQVLADAIKYHQSFLDYYDTYHRHNANFPIDKWFCLSDFFFTYRTEFSGERATGYNPEVKAFYEGTVDEKCMKKIWIFLCQRKNANQALQDLKSLTGNPQIPMQKVSGCNTCVLYYFPCAQDRTLPIPMVFPSCQSPFPH